MRAIEFERALVWKARGCVCSRCERFFVFAFIDQGIHDQLVRARTVLADYLLHALECFHRLVALAGEPICEADSLKHRFGSLFFLFAITDRAVRIHDRGKRIFISRDRLVELEHLLVGLGQRIDNGQAIGDVLSFECGFQQLHRLFALSGPPEHVTLFSNQC